MTGRDSIGRAWRIANELQQEGWRCDDVGVILAMALGIYMEGAGGHRNLQLLSDAMLTAAQIAFDALRNGTVLDAHHREET